MSNIHDVLRSYVAVMKDKFTFSGIDGSKYYPLRLGVDKGGEGTKISLSFANLGGCQSPYSQIIIGAYSGPDTNGYLAKSVPEIFSNVSKISRYENIVKNQSKI